MKTVYECVGEKNKWFWCRLQVARRRGSLCVRAAQVSSNDFKTGMTIEFDGAPWKVVGE